MVWYVIILLVVGIIVGLILDAVAKDKEVPGGVWGLIIAGILGSWLGEIALGDWGWMLQDYNVVAGIIGAVVIAGLYLLLFNKNKVAA